MGLDTTAIGIYAIGCYFAICANRKLSICPFDGTVSIESRFSSSRHIATGKYASYCVQSTVCFYISGSGQICHFCSGFLYISAFYICRFSIGTDDRFSFTIIVCFICRFGSFSMFNVVDGNAG